MSWKPFEGYGKRITPITPEQEIPKQRRVRGGEKKPWRLEVKTKPEFLPANDPNGRYWRYSDTQYADWTRRWPSYRTERDARYALAAERKRPHIQQAVHERRAIAQHRNRSGDRVNADAVEAQDNAVVDVVVQLHECVRASGLHQSAIARRLNVTRSHVSQVLNGGGGNHGNLTIRTLAAFAWACGFRVVITLERNS